MSIELGDELVLDDLILIQDDGAVIWDWEYHPHDNSWHTQIAVNSRVSPPKIIIFDNVERSEEPFMAVVAWDGSQFSWDRSTFWDRVLLQALRINDDGGSRYSWLIAQFVSVCFGFGYFFIALFAFKFLSSRPKTKN